MSFTHAEKSAVWNKAEQVPGQDKDRFRKDQCGAWIRWDAYGNRNDRYGWEIDHITPVSRGGSNALSNLRALHWENNASRGNGRLVCVVKSSGVENVPA